MPLFSSNKPDLIVRCLCPVCDKYLGTKLDSETKVFKDDTDCDHDWIFFPGKKLPKGLKHNHKPSAHCGCGGCGR